LSPETDDDIRAAYSSLLSRYCCSTDDILADPTLRTLFLARLAERVGQIEERAMLHRLLYLRKRRLLPTAKGVAGVP
jgi:hypothetical protein